MKTKFEWLKEVQQKFEHIPNIGEETIKYRNKYRKITRGLKLEDKGGEVKSRERE